MKIAVVSEATGRIVFTAQAPEAYITDQVPEGHIGVQHDLDETVHDSTHAVVDGAVVRRAKPLVTPEVQVAEARLAIVQEEALSLRALREAVLELAKTKPDYNHPSIVKLAATEAAVKKLRAKITKVSK